MTDSRRFFISTFHVGGIYSTTNWHGIGLGMDVFYNDAVSNETTEDSSARNMTTRLQTRSVSDFHSTTN